MGWKVMESYTYENDLYEIRIKLKDSREVSYDSTCERLLNDIYFMIVNNFAYSKKDRERVLRDLLSFEKMGGD